MNFEISWDLTFFASPQGTAPRLGVLPLFLVCCSVLLGLSVAAFEDWPAAIGCRDQTMWRLGGGWVVGWGWVGWGGSGGTVRMW